METCAIFTAVFPRREGNFSDVINVNVNSLFERLLIKKETWRWLFIAPFRFILSIYFKIMELSNRLFLSD